MPNQYDAIIIGTGAGGGTLAFHLAQAGKRILILERGPFLPQEKLNWDTSAVFLDNHYHTKDVWLDKNDQPVTRTKLGEPVHVRLKVRSVGDERFTNVAIVDLLPGGFEVVGSSLQPGVSTISGVDYVDLREDRAVFYATVSGSVLEINYQIKSSNRGEFTVPPTFAEAMYDRAVKGRGIGGKISVTE